jgi:hypothetical protein
MKIRVARALIQVALSPLIFAACNDSTAPNPGLAWRIVPSGTVNELDGVWGTSASNVWAVGYETILHYDGATWSTVAGGSGSTLFGIWLFGIWGSSASNIWAVGFEAGGTPALLHYDGANWSTVPSPSSSTNYSSVSGSSASVVWVADADGFVSHYDGTSWSIVSTGTTRPLTAVWASSPSDVWAVGFEGMFHYNGVSWAPVAGMSGEFLALSGTSQSDVWAVGQGHAGASHYDGTSWSGGPQDPALPEYALGVWASSRTAAWAVGVNTVNTGSGFVSKIAHYNGTTWSDVAVGKSSAILVAAWGSSATDVWVVGDGGTILHGTPTM